MLKYKHCKLVNRKVGPILWSSVKTTCKRNLGQDSQIYPWDSKMRKGKVFWNRKCIRRKSRVFLLEGTKIASQLAEMSSPAWLESNKHSTDKWRALWLAYCNALRGSPKSPSLPFLGCNKPNDDGHQLMQFSGSRNHEVLIYFPS